MKILIAVSLLSLLLASCAKKSCHKQLRERYEALGQQASAYIDVHSENANPDTLLAFWGKERQIIKELESCQLQNEQENAYWNRGVKKFPSKTQTLMDIKKINYER